MVLHGEMRLLEEMVSQPVGGRAGAGAHQAEAELSAPRIQASGRSRTGWLSKT